MKLTAVFFASASLLLFSACGGQNTAPNLTPPGEEKSTKTKALEMGAAALQSKAPLMEKMISTYGKTWHTWHTDQKIQLPLESPQLMMGFTADGQINPQLVAERDKRFEISSEEKKKNRADIPTPPIQPGADAWQTGDVKQLPSLTSVTAPGHPHAGQTKTQTDSASKTNGM